MFCRLSAVYKSGIYDVLVDKASQPGETDTGEFIFFLCVLIFKKNENSKCQKPKPKLFFPESFGLVNSDQASSRCHSAPILSCDPLLARTAQWLLCAVVYKPKIPQKKQKQQKTTTTAGVT